MDLKHMGIHVLARSELQAYKLAAKEWRKDCYNLRDHVDYAIISKPLRYVEYRHIIQAFLRNPLADKISLGFGNSRKVYEFDKVKDAEISEMLKAIETYPKNEGALKLSFDDFEAKTEFELSFAEKDDRIYCYELFLKSLLTSALRMHPHRTYMLRALWNPNPGPETQHVFAEHQQRNRPALQNASQASLDEIAESK